jgi:acetyl esterase/lipase
MIALAFTIAGCADGRRPAEPATTGSPSMQVEPTVSATLRQSGFGASRVERDVEYCTGGGKPLTMDVYYPAGGSPPRPAAVYVHGGGFRSGDKSSGIGLFDAPELIRRGYVVFSVNYRLAPPDSFPAAIEDVKCAIRSLRANATRYGIDAKRIGVWGTSAGGTLVALLGLAGPEADLEGKGGYPDQSSGVSAVVDMFGVADFTSARVQQMIPAFLPGSGQQVKELARRASPISYASPGDPPFLILHGEKDTTLSIAQSESLDRSLNAVGVTSTFVSVTNGGHGFIPSGGPISPTRVQITEMVADFFDRYVKLD